MVAGDRLRISRPRYRTAVVGLEQAGKSVFLMSLLDRMHRMDGYIEPRGLGSRSWSIRRLPIEHGWPAFPLDAAREAVRQGAWPEKTVGASQYRLGFVARRTGLTRIDPRPMADAEEHVFFDLAGERLADFAMGGRDYDQWCDYQEATLRGMTAMRAPIGAYFRRLDEVTGEADILVAYKTLLATLSIAQTPAVSPSTFAVYPEHGYPDGLRDPAAYNRLPASTLIGRGICGLDSESEFALLDAGARSRLPELASTFAERYERYRDTIVRPFSRAFGSCDQILFLVHIPGILAAGPGAMHATRAAIKGALELLQPGRSRLERAGQVLRDTVTGGRAPAIAPARIGFVATKADEVHSEDRPRLLTLLRSLTSGLYDPASAGKTLEVDHFVCSAVRVGADAEYPWVAGFIPDLHAGSADATAPEKLVYRRLRSSVLPGVWPEHPGESLRFASFRPPPPGEHGLDFLSDRPLPSLGMDDVLRFIRWRHFPKERV